VAEGVENEDELRAVERLGIPLLQGYRFGHAEPATVVAERVSADLVAQTAWRADDVIEQPLGAPAEEEPPTAF
jgi:EAL domain-containing protein (putative c-di-GMP-specific phosphodiesterase class I)